MAFPLLTGTVCSWSTHVRARRQLWQTRARFRLLGSLAYSLTQGQCRDTTPTKKKKSLCPCRDPFLSETGAFIYKTPALFLGPHPWAQTLFARPISLLSRFAFHVERCEMKQMCCAIKKAGLWKKYGSSLDQTEKKKVRHKMRLPHKPFAYLHGLKGRPKSPQSLQVKKQPLYCCYWVLLWFQDMNNAIRKTMSDNLNILGIWVFIF